MGSKQNECCQHRFLWCLCVGGANSGDAGSGSSVGKCAFTASCPACDETLLGVKGRGGVPHSEQCRERTEKTAREDQERMARIGTDLTEEARPNWNEQIMRHSPRGGAKEAASVSARQDSVVSPRAELGEDEAAVPMEASLVEHMLERDATENEEEVQRVCCESS